MESEHESSQATKAAGAGAAILHLIAGGFLAFMLLVFAIAFVMAAL